MTTPRQTDSYAQPTPPDDFDDDVEATVEAVDAGRAAERKRLGLSVMSLNNGHGSDWYVARRCESYVHAQQVLGATDGQ